jgi:hypothetical protein
MSGPTNCQRAGWARNALAIFTAETYSGDPDTMELSDLECAIGDLICDLLHFAVQKSFDPKSVLDQGEAHFKFERQFPDD